MDICGRPNAVRVGQEGEHQRIVVVSFEPETCGFGGFYGYQTEGRYPNATAL